MYEKGIDVPFRPFDCHPDLQPYFFKHNFSFEKQDLFYYQWYADWQRNEAFNKPVDFEGFYRIKDMHETLESRNMEGKWRRQNILNRRHWGFKEQQAMIYNPKWVNILNPKLKLIKEPKYF